MKDCVLLIGFMGSGKTTIGKRLARKMGAEFLDTDEMIVQREGRPITEIFTAEGEGYFRDLETKVLEELLVRDNRCRQENNAGTFAGSCVISVGGGLPVREVNRKLMKQLGTVVFLEASTDTLVGRLSGDRTRPMLQGAQSLQERIDSLKTARMDQYLDAAELRVTTDGKNIPAIVFEIMDALKKD